MQYRKPVQSTRPGIWAAEEIEILRDLAGQGVRAGAIASVLQRTEAGVRGKAKGCGIDLISDRMPRPVTLRRFASAQGPQGQEI